MNAIELKAGPELDEAVGKAIGLTCRIVENHVDDVRRYGRVCVDTGESFWDVFQPSTSLNTAFEAAENVGLFDTHDPVKHIEPGCVSWLIEPKDGCETVAEAEALAVAICRAIIKLQRAKPAALAGEHSPPAR
jgi:hypothetical protein